MEEPVNYLCTFVRGSIERHNRRKMIAKSLTETRDVLSKALHEGTNENHKTPGPCKEQKRLCIRMYTRGKREACSPDPIILRHFLPRGECNGEYHSG